MKRFTSLGLGLLVGALFIANAYSQESKDDPNFGYVRVGNLRHTTIWLAPQ